MPTCRATDSVIRNATITNPGTNWITFHGETDTTTIERTTVSEAGTVGVRFSGTADTVLFDQLTVDRAAKALLPVEDRISKIRCCRRPAFNTATSNASSNSESLRLTAIQHSL
jgi:hypothetical protein